MKKESAADNVDKYLQGLENSTDEDVRPLQIEQETFNDTELSRLINTEKLQRLLDSSDDFLSHLSGEIDEFDQQPIDSFKITLLSWLCSNLPSKSAT